MEHRYENESLNRKYKVLKEVEEVEDDSSNILIIYLKGLFSFFEKIPQDYEHKERILYMCYNIRDSLFRSAPEIISSKYLENTMKMVRFLPEEDTDWNTDAWNNILEASKKANIIIDMDLE